MAKILVAEDDPIARKILCACIEGMGHSCLQSSDGADALNIIRDNADVAMLVTDMSMPNVTGRGLIETVRSSNFANKDMPIIIVSGVVGLNEISDLLKVGASRFLPKPVNIDDLKRYVKLLVKS